jgi:hypothetical protein
VNFVIKLIGNGLVAALDFCMGAFIATAVMKCYGIDSLITPIIGGIIGLAPDVDLSYYFKRNGRPVDHHRSALHYPLLCIPIAAIIVCVLWGAPWALATAFCLMAHYIHDATGPYGGLVAFWPFSQDSFGANGRERIGVSKRERYIQEVGHETWIKTYWLKPSILSVSELGLALLFAGGAYAIDHRLWWIVGLSTASWFAALAVWLTGRSLER